MSDSVFLQSASVSNTAAVNSPPCHASFDIEILESEPVYCVFSTVGVVQYRGDIS